MSAKKQSVGSKLSRTETITIRLDPKMRYLADLASRIHRRTLSSYVEWAINESFSGVILPNSKTSIATDAERLWDVDEPDRFVYLASKYSSLLTHEEQKLWKLIREYELLWEGVYDEDGVHFLDKSNPDHLRMQLLRERWELFQSIARNDARPSALQQWEIDNAPTAPTRSKSIPKTTTKTAPTAAVDNFDDFPGSLQDDDDDLPF